MTDHVCRKQIHQLTLTPFIRKHKNTKNTGGKNAEKERNRDQTRTFIVKMRQSSGFWGKHSFFPPIQMFQLFRSLDQEKRIRLLFLWGNREVPMFCRTSVIRQRRRFGAEKLTGPPTSGGRHRPVLLGLWSLWKKKRKISEQKLVFQVSPEQGAD